MERETWKNLGLVGAAVVAIGCSGMWYFGAKQEEIVVATATPPPKVPKPKPPVVVKPTPVESKLVVGPNRPPRPPEPAPVKPRPPKPTPSKAVEKRKPINAG